MELVNFVSSKLKSGFILMRIAYLLPRATDLKKGFSGTHLSIYHTFVRKGHTVDVISIPQWMLILAFLAHRLLYKRHFVLSDIHSRFCGWMFSWKIRSSTYDCAVVVNGIFCASYLQVSIPIYLIDDTTPRALIDYYPYLRDLPPSFKESMLRRELKSIQKATAFFGSSEWSLRAFRDSNPDLAHKLHVLPFGSNKTPAPQPSDVEKYITERRGDPVFRLLLVGVDWERKGASIAVDVARELHSRNRNIELTICGCTPPDRESVTESYITIIPFLSKHIPEEAARFDQLFVKSHLFLFPTRQECCAMVLAESGSFGMPSISTDTGGVETAILHNETGFLIAEDAEIREYADYVEQLMDDRSRYESMARASRSFYDSVLNWDKWYEGFITKTRFSPLSPNS